MMCEPTQRRTPHSKDPGRRSTPALPERVESNAARAFSIITHTMTTSSDHFDGKRYRNLVATPMMEPGGSGWLGILIKFLKGAPGREPTRRLGPFLSDPSRFADLGDDTLRVTWLGHSGVILEIDGARLLIDPLWYERASPVPFAGPKRFFANPIAIDALPPIDSLLISHDHYDHLDKRSILRLAARGTPIVTMRGVGERLIKWGVRADQVTELDWWDAWRTPKGIAITAAPTRHFSGRGLFDRMSTLWGAFAIRGPRHNVYFGSDSGYFEGFRETGARLGPFDLTMIETGAYDVDWRSIHSLPEESVRQHVDLGGGLMMPIHWGTFALAMHPWKEPIERAMAEAERLGVPMLVPAPGETRDIADGAYLNPWWKAYD